MPTLEQMIRRARGRKRMPMYGSPTSAVYEFNQAPGSTPGVEDITDEMEAPEAEGQSDEAMAMQAEASQSQDVLRRQMTDMVSRVFGGEPPVFEGNTMRDPTGNVINLDNQEAVAEYASTLMDAMPEEASPSPGMPGKQFTDKERELFAGKQFTDRERMEGAPAPAPRRLQMPPMAVRGRGPEEQAMDMMVSRSLARTKKRMGIGGRPRDLAEVLRQGIGNVEVEGVIEEASPQRLADVYGQRLASVTDKLGFDPTTRDLPPDTDLSQFTAGERFLLRQLGALKRPAPAQRTVKRRRR